MSHKLTQAPILAALVLAALGCKPVNDRKEITTTREVGEFAPQALLDLSLRERLGIEAPERSGGAESPFAWQAAESWKPAPGSSMRVANFTFGPNGEGECYFSVIPGGGDLLLNLNRWRSQMALPAVDGEAAAALPDRPLLFGTGKLVDLRGEFTAMGVTEAKPGYRMMGVILPEVELEGTKVAFFVKMTGPEALVEAEVANFDAFCASLKIVSR